MAAAEATEYHRPVLLAEVITYLRPGPGMVLVDLTVGGGGHTTAFAERIGAEGRILALDRDPDAIAAAREQLARYSERVQLFQRRFDEVAKVLDEQGITSVDGVLADLGVSSHQLDTADRGFSFSRPGPLDMRMDPTQGETAAEWLARSSEDELTDAFYRWGEERWARAIARRIVAERGRSPIRRTSQLANLVAASIPKGARPREIHPATRVFQAIRIAVNDELTQIEPMIRQSVQRLKTGGRLVVIAFHSLEDRIVKTTFQRLAGACTCPPGLPVCACGARADVRLLTRKPVTASGTELELNPRSRSAKLRAVERILFSSAG